MLQPPPPPRARKPTYTDRAVALAQVLGTASPDNLGGVCVDRCQIKQLCGAGLLVRVSYGRYQIGPAAKRLPKAGPANDAANGWRAADDAVAGGGRIPNERS